MRLRLNAAIRHFDAAIAAARRVEGVDDQQETAVAVDLSGARNC
jgi:hypothetical protein